MTLAVDQLSLGQIGTNCYLVRADRDATDAVVVDPGADAAEIRLSLARSGATCAAILRHAQPLRPHRRARRPRRGHGRAGLAAGRASSTSSAARTTSSRASRVRAVRGRGDAARRRRDGRGRRASRSRCVHVPGHSPGHVAYYADGCLFSGDVLFAGSVGRTDLPFGDWETLLELDPLARRRAIRPRRVVYSGPRPADDARRRARAQPVPRRAPRVTAIRGPRGHARRPPVRAAALAAASRARWSGSARSTATGGSRRPVRGHRALRAHLGRGLRRRPEGDVHLHRPRRPLADAAPGGDGADLPRLRRARPAPASRSRQKLYTIAPMYRYGRPAAAATASTGSSRSRRSARTTRRSTPR